MRRRWSHGLTLVEALAVLAILAIGAFILFPVFARSSHGGHRDSVMGNLKQLALATIMYAADYEERLPPAEKWMDVIEPYHKNTMILHDPTIKDAKEDEYGFAFFEPVSFADLERIANLGEVPMVFQSVLLGRNAHSDLRTLPSVPRNGKSNWVSFLDGHAKAFPPTWPHGPITIVIDPSGAGGGEKK